MDESERLLKEWRIIRINAAVGVHFDLLIGNRSLRKIGRPDLLIASIALANQAILVTRNVHDFALVPRLTIENWVDS